MDRHQEKCNKNEHFIDIYHKYKFQNDLSIKDIDFGKISYNSCRHITSNEHKELIKRCKPEKNDILYTKNGTIGIAKVVDWDYEFSVFVSLCLIKPNLKIIRPIFLETFLNTPFALHQAKSNSKKGTITNLHLIDIRRMKIPLPSLSEQDFLIKRIMKIKFIEEKQLQSIKDMNKLFKALLQKAFTGELM